MDLLSDHLVRARATGAVFARTVAEPPWGLRLGGSIQLSVHTVVRGRGYLWLDSPGSTVELIPGSVTLVRGGVTHSIGHEPGAACLEPEEFRARHAHAGPADNPRATVFLCGAYRFSGDVGAGLLDALPQVMTFAAADDDPLREVITMLSRELVRTEPAQQLVLDRLLDLLLVLAIRSEFRRSATAPRWFRAAADPRLGAGLQAMHEDPAHSWTVTELAELSGLSRAAFARVFREALGQAPMQYLTNFRMALARDHLRADGLTLPQIADAVGYGSAFAFAAAFRRHHGEPPGAWRHRERAAADTHLLTPH
ncbi:AraC family transcriptional regulator [Streptacidiphilus jiangxiensis]|uniref:AraC-type DNA-binding protein n=1 Tax=Streptacidiphilus jiangxiensis TaxID=235985 RepID=A0A1H7P466_STRJI|nr:AraC family transcriptional regulator [Streptacidiphilus jiangxiensis]SEL30563.1 AraC-type DNA-binding protein [Streptacidiphilus jiangxiensis]